ncbi:MAG: YfdX family protein [Nitrococcus sp.]|nr:YfdX family protein [Nitrococcus sp.]
MNKQHLRAAAILPFALALTFGGSAFAQKSSTQKSNITADINTQPDETLSVKERTAVSFAAGRILVHVQQARRAIAADNVEAAKQNLQKAMTLANIVESALPTYTVATNIEANGMSYKDTRKVQPLVVGLYDDLDKVAILDPVMAAKKEAAKKAGIPPTTIELLLDYSQVTLNVAAAKARLEAAQKILDNKNNSGDLEAADQALTLIQTQAVDFSYVSIDIPLREARANLLLARNLVQQERVQDARFALMEAADALQKYQSQVGDNRAKHVSALRQEISSLAENIKQGGAKNAEDKITQWWNQVDAWFGGTSAMQG